MSAATRWSVLFLALFAGIFGAFQNGKMPAALPTLTAELGLTLVEAGWAVSLLYGITTVLGLAAGAFADLWGARRFVVAGLLIVAAASFAGGFATGALGLLATRFCEGFGLMAVFVAAPAIILRAAAPRDQRLAFGIWSGYMPAGTSFMILVTPLVIGAVGWRGLWWLNTALLAGFAALFWVATRRIADPRAATAGRMARLRGDVGAVLRARGPWLLALTFATYTANYLCVASFLPTLLIAGGFSQLLAGTLVALVVAANVAGNLFSGWLLQKGASRGLLIAIAAASMGALSLVVYATGLGAGAKLAAAFAYSFVGGLLPAAVMGGAPVHAPSPAQIGTTNGLILQWGNFGQLVAPPIFAALATAGGWSTAAWFTLALGAAGAALGLAIRRHEGRTR
ncbi:MAG: MFS transporter [Alphaproteobacteria bacterium]